MRKKIILGLSALVGLGSFIFSGVTSASSVSWIDDTTSTGINSIIDTNYNAIVLQAGTDTFMYDNDDSASTVYIETPDGQDIYNTGTDYLDVTCSAGYITEVKHGDTDWTGKEQTMTLYYSGGDSSVTVMCEPVPMEIYACPPDSQELSGCTLAVDSGTIENVMPYGCWDMGNGQENCQLSVVLNGYTDSDGNCVAGSNPDNGSVDCNTSGYTIASILDKLVYGNYLAAYQGSIGYSLFASGGINLWGLNNYKIEYTDGSVSNPVAFYTDSSNGVMDEMNGGINFLDKTTFNYSTYINIFKNPDQTALGSPLTICSDSTCSSEETDTGIDFAKIGGYVQYASSDGSLAGFFITILPSDGYTVWDVYKKLYNSVTYKVPYGGVTMDCSSTGDYTGFNDDDINAIVSNLGIDTGSVSVATGFETTSRDSTQCFPVVDVNVDFGNSYSGQYIKITDTMGNAIIRELPTSITLGDGSFMGITVVVTDSQTPYKGFIEYANTTYDNTDDNNETHYTITTGTDTTLYLNPGTNAFRPDGVGVVSLAVLTGYNPDINLPQNLFDGSINVITVDCYSDSVHIRGYESDSSGDETTGYIDVDESTTTGIVLSYITGYDDPITIHNINLVCPAFTDTDDDDGDYQTIIVKPGIEETQYLPADMGTYIVGDTGTNTEIALLTGDNPILDFQIGYYSGYNDGLGMKCESDGIGLYYLDTSLDCGEDNEDCYKELFLTGLDSAILSYRTGDTAPIHKVNLYCAPDNYGSSSITYYNTDDYTSNLPTDLVEKIPYDESGVTVDLSNPDFSEFKDIVVDGHHTDAVTLTTGLMDDSDIKIVDNSGFVYDIKYDPTTNDIVKILNCNPNNLDLKTLPKDQLAPIVACQLKKTQQIFINKDYSAGILDEDIPYAYKAVFYLMEKGEKPSDIDLQQVIDTKKEIEKYRKGSDIIERFFLDSDEDTGDTDGE